MGKVRGWCKSYGTYYPGTKSTSRPRVRVALRWQRENLRWDPGISSRAGQLAGTRGKIVDLSPIVTNAMARRDAGRAFVPDKRG